MSVLVIDGRMHHDQIYAYTDAITLLLLFAFLRSVGFQFRFAGLLSLFRGLFALRGGGRDRKVKRGAKERQAQNKGRHTPAVPIPPDGLPRGLILRSIVTFFGMNDQ